MVECLAADTEMQTISLNQFSLLVDLYHYLPHKVKKTMPAKVRAAIFKKNRYVNQEPDKASTFLNEIDIERVLNLS